MAKLVLVIGGTGAQGFEVVEALQSVDPSFSIRVLTRDPDNSRVKEQFKDSPAELVKGSFMDGEAIRSALQGCYGVFVNTSGFSVNDSDELSAAVSIYEEAARTAGLRHFVWSGIDYFLKLANFNPKYGSHHANAKGRFSEYLRSQPSDYSPNSLAWTIINPPAYTDMLQGGLFQPQIKPDGKRIFAFPLSHTGRIPLITLRDIGAFARAIFLAPEAWSGRTLYPGSHYATGPEIAATFTRVTGLRAEYLPLTMAQWKATLGEMGKAPLIPGEIGGVTMADNFAMTWPAFEDEVFVERDFEQLKKVHPELESLEDWMRRVAYDGTPRPFLKGVIDRMDTAGNATEA